MEPRDAYIKAVDKTGFEGLLRRENLDATFIRTMTDEAAALPAALSAGLPVKTKTAA